MPFSRSTLTAVLLFLVPATAGAAEPKSLGDFGPWRAYAAAEAGGRLCYATAAAAHTQGGEKGRKPTWLAVTHRPKHPNEVSLIGAYGFKKDSGAEIAIDGKKHPFFTKGDSAWAKNADDDKAIVAALLKGREATVHATPGKGKAVVDTIPLTGFAKALAAIDKACKVKH